MNIALPLPAPDVRERASNILLDLRAGDLVVSPELTARSGQALTVSRAHTADATDSLGTTYTAASHELRLDYPSPDIATILLENAATAGALDSVTMPLFWLPQPCTVYGKCYLGAAIGASDVLFAIGSSNINSTAQRGLGLVRGNTGALAARVTTGSTTVDATSGVVASGVHEFIAQFDATGISLSIDGGTPATNTVTLPSTFSTATIVLLGDNNVRWVTLKIASGLKTLAVMRSIA